MLIKTSTTKIKLLHLAFFIISLTLLALTPATAATKQITVSKNQVEKAINQALSRVKVHIDNLGARNGGSFLQQDSYVAIKVKGNTQLTYRFPIAETSFTINKAGGRYLRFYVSDFNSSSLKVTLVPKYNGNLFLNIGFESKGAEIQGRCVTRRGVVKRRWEECRLDLNRNAHINNALLKVWAPIIVRNGKLSFGQPKANFKSSIAIDNRLCKIAKKACSTIESRIRGEIAKQVVGNIKKSLVNSRPRIEKIMRSVHPSLKKVGVKVVKIKDLGNRYKVTINTP